MATPIIEEAHKKWPEAKITLLCKDQLLPLFLHHPLVDRLLPLSSATKLHADIGILLPNSFSSAWHFFIAGVKMRIGFRADGRSLLLTHPKSFPKEKEKMHLVDTYKQLLDVAGSTSKPTIYVSEKEKYEAKQRFTSHKPLIGINPLAAYGPAKCWPADKFRELAVRLKEFTLLFFGDAQGKEIVSEICSDLPHVVNLAGKTSLRELIGLISCCDLFVTNDSGPMHIAAALTIPLLALFGSTNEIVTGPYHHGRVIHKHVSCSPCYKRVCPIDFRCMQQISVDEVEQQIISLLGSGSHPVKCQRE